ncbi:hypothetical protein VTK56DRAFT_2619 [Thermocarpiscus australiensis]
MDDSPAEARYARLRWNAPLSEDHADELLDHLKLSSKSSIVDLGCGWASCCCCSALRRGRRAAAPRPWLGRLVLSSRAAGRRLAGDDAKAARSASGPRMRSAGAERRSYGWPRLCRRAGGRALVGDMCWERPPTEAARAVFGDDDDVPMLADLVAACRETGWEVLLRLSVANQREWDNFESGYRAGLREWLLANPDSPQAGEIREEQDAREREYLTAYRGVLGFVYPVLGR